MSESLEPESENSATKAADAIIEIPTDVPDSSTLPVSEPPALVPVAEQEQPFPTAQAAEDTTSPLPASSKKTRKKKKKRNFSFLWIVLIVGAVGAVLFTGFHFWNKRKAPVKIVQPQVSSRKVVEEKVKEEIPELDYSEINRREMEKLPKVQQSIASSTPAPKQKEFWPVFFDILTDKVVGTPPAPKKEVSKNWREKYPEKKESTPSVAELPKKQVALKPPVQEAVQKKVSQPPVKKIEKQKTELVVDVKWVENENCLIPVRLVKGRNIGFIGSKQPQITKPSAWQGAQWRLVGTSDNCYWALVK